MNKNDHSSDFIFNLLDMALDRMSEEGTDEYHLLIRHVEEELNCTIMCSGLLNGTNSNSRVLELEDAHGNKHLWSIVANKLTKVD